MNAKPYERGLSEEQRKQSRVKKRNKDPIEGVGGYGKVRR